MAIIMHTGGVHLLESSRFCFCNSLCYIVDTRFFWSKNIEIKDSVHVHVHVHVATSRIIPTMYVLLSEIHVHVGGDYMENHIT